jgi:signal transduction histidine kinase/ActR/RegA family two-component response regulator
VGVFGSLYVQSLMKTRKRVPWQHHVLTTVAVLNLIGAIVNWFIPPHISAVMASVLASFGVIFIFGVALHANMEEYVLARHFIVVRAITACVALIAIFNVNGLLPQGAFSSWGVAATIIFETLVMFISTMAYRAERLRDKAERSPAVEEKKIEVRTLVNLSDICHELRTPISGVLGMADLLMSGNMTDQQRNQIKTIHNSGLMLLDVTNRLTDLSSIERGNVDVNSAPFELTGLIESCVENCRGRAEVGKVELIYHIDSSIVGFVKGDQEKIQHVIVNLLQFALRNVEQGEVVLSAKTVEDNQILFEIHSGQNTLMDRHHAARTRELHSSDNLNLTIAEQYLYLMGGKFNMQLFANGGAIIEFSLPLDVHSSPAHPTEDALSLQGRRLLIVDDNVTYCSIVEQQATQWGMIVQSAHGGTEALAILRSHTNTDELFDIALIDFEMPGMDGLELAAHIRADQKINSEKMIMMMLTGVSRAPSKPILENAGIHRALYKPLSGKSLKQALQSALMR